MKNSLTPSVPSSVPEQCPMTTPYKKKLIEVALPLEDINREATREKSIRHGHPSTLHLWWARRPLVACRPVLFGSLMDDSSGCIEELLTDGVKLGTAGKELAAHREAWGERRAGHDEAWDAVAAAIDR
jgi:putative DNA methylase